MVSDRIEEERNRIDNTVLILVLVEDGLWQAWDESIVDKIYDVLILVLVEDGLWQQESA